MKKNKAKAVATLALAGALLTTPFAAQAANFKDVGANHWAYSYISKLSDLRIIKGYDDGTFKPLRNVSYLEILELLKGVQNPTSTEMTSAIATYGYIADAYKVPNWAKPAVCIALQNNVITEGNLKAAYKLNYINNVRNADQFPSRELALVYYAKALRIEPKKDTSNIKVTDVDSVGKTSKELIGNVDVKGLLASMIDAGIFSAFGTGVEFKGNLPLQRDQMAKITDMSYEYKSVKSFEGEVVAVVKYNGVPALSIKDKDGKTQAFALSKDTVITMNGKSAKAEDLRAGSKVKVKAFPQSGGIAPYQAVSVEVVSTELSGVGMVDSAKFDEIKIAYSTKKDAPIDGNFKAEKTDSFKVNKDTAISILGKKAELRSLSTRDMVVFKAQDGVLKEVEVFPYNGTVSGEFVNYEYNRFGTSRIVLKLENKKEQEFIVKEEKTAKDLFDLTQKINKGYPLTLTTRYHEVVTAKAAESELSGLFEGMSLVNYDNGTIDITTSNGKRSYALDSNIKFFDLGVATASNCTPNQLYDALSKYLKKAEIELHLTGGKVDQVTVKSKLAAKDLRVNVTNVTQLPKRAGDPSYQSSTWAVNSIDNFTAYRFDFDKTNVNVKQTSLSGQLSNDYNSHISSNPGSLQLVFDLFVNGKGEEYFSNVRVNIIYYNKEIPLYPLGYITVTK